MSKKIVEDFKSRVLSSEDAYRRSKKYYINEIEKNNRYDKRKKVFNKTILEKSSKKL